MRQQLQLREGTPIVLETPMGFVSIMLGRKRRVQLDLPPGIVAHRGMERAQRAARFVEVDSEGHARPKFEVLVPETDGTGQLVGVQTPTPLRV